MFLLKITNQILDFQNAIFHDHYSFSTPNVRDMRKQERGREDFTFSEGGGGK